MRRIITLMCLSVCVFAFVKAEGYQVNSQSTKQAAMGHVGAALKLGAESMHFNPAGLVFMDKSIDLSAGVFAVFPKAEYSTGDYKHKTDNKASTPLYFYGAFKIYDFLAAGISVTNPYGSSMDWGVDWKGSSLVQDIALKSFSIQPTLSWKITERLSIGAGMTIVFGDFSLSRALIGPQGLEGLRPFAAAVPEVGTILDKYTDASAVSATLSGDAGVKLGYNIGAMFDITDQFTIGVSYRSKVMMKVNEGLAVVNYANRTELEGLLATVNPILEAAGGNPITVPPLDGGTFEAELPLPSNFCVGLSYNPNERWLFSGEVQFVGWGAYKSLNMNFKQEALSPYNVSATKEYKNTRIYRVGTQYALTNRFDLRLGAYYDETPVKDEFLNPETPSMNKLGLTTGFSFRPLTNWSVDLAFSYITGFGRDGSYPLPTSADATNTFAGHYEVSAFSPAIGLSYAF